MAAAPTAWADENPAPSDSASQPSARGSSDATHQSTVRRGSGAAAPAAGIAPGSRRGTGQVSAQTNVSRGSDTLDLTSAKAPAPAAAVAVPKATAAVANTAPATTPVAAAAVTAPLASASTPTAKSVGATTPSAAPGLGAFRAALRLNIEDLFSGGAPKVTNPDAVVAGLFQQVLRREATATELQRYVRDLNLFGVNAVIAGLYTSDAFRQNAVKNYYLRLLNKEPTQQELTLGVLEYTLDSALGSPESYAASLNLAGGQKFYDYSAEGGGEFGTKPSATTYVDLLYRSFLGAKADPIAAPQLIQSIERGLPILFAANQFVKSEAFRTVTVANIYQVLGQQGSPADIAGYVKNWIWSGGQAGISQSLLSTTANIDRIEAGLYDQPDVAAADIVQKLLLAPYEDGAAGFNEQYKTLIGQKCSDTTPDGCASAAGLAAYNLIKSGGTDRGIPNSSISNNPLVVDVATMVPTQNEINLGASLNFPLQDSALLQKIFDGGTITPFTGPVISANDGTYIVDGHHRWSQIYLINPTAQVVAKDLGYVPTPKTALRESQLGIVATTGDLKESAAGTPNVYDVTRLKFDEFVETTIYAPTAPDPAAVIATFGLNISTPEVWATLSDAAKMVEIQNFLWVNVELMRKLNPYIPFATSRVVMPQYTKDPDLVLNNLTGGSVSFSFPTISYLG